MSGSVIVAGARTPIGRLLGALKDLSGRRPRRRRHQGRAGARPASRGDQVDYVIMGQVIQAGAGQIPARQAAVDGGIPMDVPSITINKVCLSGINAIALADQLIRAGEFEIVVAGGMESMTNAPHLLPKSREGFKYGDVDAGRLDGLRRAVLTRSPTRRWARSTEQLQRRVRQLTREEQDAFAARSHQRAAEALEERRLRRRGRRRSRSRSARATRSSFTADEGVRGDTTVESLAGCARRSAKDGTITAGSASQISDGACAVVVMSKAKAEELGLTWLAEIGAHGVVAGPDSTPAEQPANAIAQGLREGGHHARRPRPGRDQRGVRRGRHRLDARARHRPRTRSTSTAAPSRSATRSACPAPGSCCTWRSSSSAAAAASARPRCAAAAARATP